MDPTLNAQAVSLARRRQRRNHEALTKDQAFEAKIKKLTNENENLAAQLQASKKEIQNLNLQLANARHRLKKKGLPEEDETGKTEDQQTEQTPEKTQGQQGEQTEQTQGTEGKTE